MANLAEKHEEEHSAQLADAEISRVLSALQKAEFKRSETGNERPDQTFKPRSLMEIAETARQQGEAVMADAITAEVAAGEVEQEIDAPTDDIASEITGSDQLDVQKSNDALENGLQDAGMEMSSTESKAPDPIDLPTTDSDLGADAGDGSSSDDAASPSSPSSPFETAQAAYDRGYGEGIEAGRVATEGGLRTTLEGEFETKFADKISAFETALFGLAKSQTFDTGALSRSLHAAVIRLAAARIGTAIDEMPELMVTRIESLADAAGKNVAAGKVFMHPDDCAVIAPVMAARQDPVIIEADPQLYRGDIRIRFDGIDISDVAELRADWKASKQVAAKNFTDSEPAQSGDLQATSAQANTAHSSITDGENAEALADGREENEDASVSGTVGLMPLTTTGGEDSKSDAVAVENEEASVSGTVGLMPLTTTGGEDSPSDAEDVGNEEASESKTAGLMPLTSKNIDE